MNKLKSIFVAAVGEERFNRVERYQQQEQVSGLGRCILHHLEKKN